MENPKTILVVDDILSNRNLVKEILQINEYFILVAGDSKIAEKISQEYSGKIDLMITDLVMPDGNGIELAKLLRPQRPEMKILYISGHSVDMNLQIEIWEKVADFLPKPFTPNSLLQKVAEMLRPSTLHGT